MGDTLTTKQHDIYPIISCALRNDDLTPISLVGVSRVNFIARPAGVATNLIKAQGTIINASLGYVGYMATYSDVATSFIRDQEWELMFAASGPQTVPNADFNTWIVTDDLDIE